MKIILGSWKLNTAVLMQAVGFFLLMATNRHLFQIGGIGMLIFGAVLYRNEKTRIAVQSQTTPLSTSEPIRDVPGKAQPGVQADGLEVSSGSNVP